MNQIYHKLEGIKNYAIKKSFPKFNTRPMIKFINSLEKKNLIGVEIGIDEGFNSINIINNLDMKILYCIDPYLPYVENKHIENNEKKLLKIKQKFRLHSNIQLIVNTSEKAVKQIPDDLDFVYIDGNHNYEFVKKDIELYYPKIKENGIIGGHDYCGGHKDVPRAVIEFVDKNDLILITSETDWWCKKIEPRS